MRIWTASLAGAVVLCSSVVPAATPNAGPGAPGITIIGDSVMTGVLWHANAVAIMQQGLNVEWQVAVCRTLTGVSCPFDGSRPPNLVQLVQSEGPQLGDTVVVECGYNDPEDTFGQAVEQSIDALLAAGVERILWVNLHAATPQLASMDIQLEAVAAEHPQVTLLDWNDYSNGHNDWFQTDLIHLTVGGGVGLAGFLHLAVMRALAPPLVAVDHALPAARVGHAYSAFVRVSGGRPPYAWRAVSGPLPRGLHLRPNGWIEGTPRRAGKVTIVFRATDSDDVAVLERQQITVAARS
jgi:Putative Ig domain